MKSSVFFGKASRLMRLVSAVAIFLAISMSGGTTRASCITLADIPLDTLQEAAPGLIMFVIDDSGSMGWRYIYPPGGSYAGNNLSSTRWASQWSGYNGIYYDPTVDYTPWPGYSDANPDNPRINPTSTGTYNLTNTTYISSTLRIAYRHYYVRNANGTFLINLNGSLAYYRVNLDDLADMLETVNSSKLTQITAAQATTAGIVTGRTYAEECQNFANWYSYYSTRINSAKSAIADVINTSSQVFIGLMFINRSWMDVPLLPVNVTLDGTTYDESATLMNTLLVSYYASGGTPLRDGLKRAGRYFQGDIDNTSSNYLADFQNSSTYPYFKADYGGACQQAFTILFSDGFYYGSVSGVNNADGDNNTAYDGPPFGDTRSNTLADVAMYYYERDLNSSLSNFVPETTIDPADHQHMVTYTIAFGVQGNLDPNLYVDCASGGACPPSWPANTNDSGKIDDMLHAAVNGRGDYISAGNTAALKAALRALQNNIITRLGAAASVATNSVQLTEGSRLYMGTYNTSNWFGEVTAYGLDTATGDVDVGFWRASEKVPAENDRTILSYNGTSGIVFKAANLTTAQKGKLTAGGLGTADELVNYLRGDTSNAVANGGTLRNRSGVLGDFVHSAPAYYNNVVYIGANDGMLHAFFDAGGEEIFAYVPNLVYDNLSELADPGYTHKYFVDNTPKVVNTGLQHILVCGLRKGGKGYFALDVTNPLGMTAGNVLWEYPNTTDGDMGYSYSEAFIVRTQAEGYVVVFGNGYDSANEEAVLYVLNAFDGTLIKKLSTGVTGCNGLSSPALVDLDSDGYVDYAYAGDLKGNLWKFDLKGATSAEWGVSYKNGGTPMPLITVKNKSGQAQPITAPPTLMLDCAKMSEGRGLMVFFGTGQYLNGNDFDDATVQSLYGVWDWGPVWEGKENNLSADADKYLGTLDTDRTLSNMDSSISLLEQTVLYESGEYLLTSNKEITYYDPVEDIGSHMGWVFDLPQSKERLLNDILVRKGMAIYVSTIPSDSPCAVGGSSVIYQLNACSGGNPHIPVFDSSGDDKLTEEDVVTWGGSAYFWSAMKSPDRLYSPTEIGSDGMIIPDQSGNLHDEELPTNLPGMFFWRVLEH